MNLKTLQYDKNAGWLETSFPDMDSENTLILVFAAPCFIDNPTPIEEIRKRYPLSKILGCSDSGEIFGMHIYDNSLSVAIVQFEKTLIKTVHAEIHDIRESVTAGENIARQLAAPNLRGIFVISEGLNVNGSELVNGLNKVGDKEVVITGGLAGDGSRFHQTWVIYDGRIIKNSVVGIGFYGDHIHIGHGSCGGWDIFGPERTVTRSQNNILYELDGKPALKLYKEYLRERAKELPASGLLFPLAIRKNPSDSNQLVRTILAVDEKEQSLTFAGDIPGGYLAQLMRANFDRIIAAADNAADLAINSMKVIEHGTHPILAVAISCVGRRLLLGERTEEEIEATLSSLPAGTQQVGFYSYGELSPYAVGKCDLHNQTMTLTTFYED